jgi:hypothetical protein
MNTSTSPFLNRNTATMMSRKKRVQKQNASYQNSANHCCHARLKNVAGKFQLVYVVYVCIMVITLVFVETANVTCMSYKNAVCTAGSTLHLYDHGNGPSNTPIPRQRSDLNRIIQMSQFTPSCTQLNQRNTETNSFCETTPKRHESAFTFLCCCIGYWTIKTEFAELPFT